MVKSNITNRELREELDSIMSSAQELIPAYGDIIPSIICPVFDKQGYQYTIDPESGNFTINVDEYSSIRGEFQYDQYRIYLTSSISNISAHSREITHLALTDFSLHIPFFNTLIAGARKLAARFHNLQKLKKSAELLTVSMVQPCINKLNLKRAILVAPENEPGTVIVRIPICNNYSIQTRVNFDNFEQRCEDLALAYKYVSPFFSAKLKKLMIFHRYPEFDDTIFSVVIWDKCGTRRIYKDVFKNGTCTNYWNVNNIKIEYQDPAVINKLIPDDGFVSKSKVVNSVLDELRFRYYASKGVLIVFINENHILTREESTHKVIFQKYSDHPEKELGSSLTKVMHDEEFIKLLKLIAIKPTIFNSIYESPNVVLMDLFLSICPDNWAYTVIFKHGPLEILVDKKYWLTLPMSSGQFVNAIWALVSNQDLLNNLSNPLPDKPHIMMHIDMDYSYEQYK